MYDSHRVTTNMCMWYNIYAYIQIKLSQNILHVIHFGKIILLAYLTIDEEIPETLIYALVLHLEIFISKCQQFFVIIVQHRMSHKFFFPTVVFGSIGDK